VLSPGPQFENGPKFRSPVYSISLHCYAAILLFREFGSCRIAIGCTHAASIRAKHCIASNIRNWHSTDGSVSAPCTTLRTAREYMKYS